MNPFRKSLTAKSLKIITPVFVKMQEELIKEFSNHYEIDATILLDYQLYGFDHYDTSKPNLKEYIHIKTGVGVNGKYLYNKVRESKKGHDEIKLTREYTYIYFNALGYKDVFEFIESPLLEEKEKQGQLKLLGIYESANFDDEYYVGYYYGEDHEIIKTKLTIYNSYKNVDWVLFYWENEQEPSQYRYKGIVTEVKGTIAFYFSIENAATERNVLISIFFGNRNIINKPFLKGVYSGFDRNNSPVAGELIFQRVISAEEQEKEVLSKQIDITIRNEIVNRRLIVSSTLPQNKFELSEDSIYANRLINYSGKYIGFLMNTGKDKLNSIELTVEENSNKAVLKFTDNRIFHGYFKLVGRGEVLHGYFDLSETYTGFNIVLNANFHKEKFLLGVYSGIGQYNRPVGGRISFVKLDEMEDKEEVSYSFESVSNFEQLINKSRFLGKFFLGNEDQFSVSHSALEKLNEKLFSNKTSQNSTHIGIVTGRYEIYYHDEHPGFLIKDVLSIAPDGSVLIQSPSYLYHGHAKIFGDGILSIQITSLREQDFYSQYLIFIGRYQNNEIKVLSGICNTLSKDYSPIAQKVVLIKKEEEFNTLKSKRYTIDNQYIMKLCNENVSLKALIDSASTIIKTERLVEGV